MTFAFARRRFVQAAAAGSVIGSAAGQAVAQSPQAETAPPLTVGHDAATPPRVFAAPEAVRELRIASLEDLEAEAQRIIDPGAFAYIASGADNQWTLRENRRAFARLAIRPQYLVGKGAPDLATTLFGSRLSMPVITAPMGAHGLAHRSAELGTARGTGEAGTLMTVSTAANRTIEEIAAATTGPKWFQLYLQDDRERSRELLRRAEAAGYSAVVLSIDAFAPGSSDAVIRLGFRFPPELPLVNSGTSRFKASLGWEDVAFVQQNTRLPLVLKGVVTPEMARMALERGIAGIQVSNHGGRQLDGVPAAIDLLPAIVAEVQGRVPVILDSGIRRGGDVFKALALGANAVALGRPLLYALSLGGWVGVRSAYERLRTELVRDMLIAGIGSVAEFNRDFVLRAAEATRG